MKPAQLWVIDANVGKVIKRKRMPRDSGEAIGWIDNSTVGMALLDGDKLTPVLRLRGKQPKVKIPVYGWK